MEQQPLCTVYGLFSEVNIISYLFSPHAYTLFTLCGELKMNGKKAKAVF